MTRPANVERIREVPLAWAFDFTRERDHVWATVELGFGVALIVSSDAPHSPRTWTLIGSVTARVIRTPGTSISSADEIPYDSELGRALATAWDSYVSREAQLAVYTPENRGSAQIREEAP